MRLVVNYDVVDYEWIPPAMPASWRVYLRKVIHLTLQEEGKTNFRITLPRYSWEWNSSVDSLDEILLSKVLTDITLSGYTTTMAEVQKLLKKYHPSNRSQRLYELAAGYLIPVGQGPRILWMLFKDAIEGTQYYTLSEWFRAVYEDSGSLPDAQMCALYGGDEACFRYMKNIGQMLDRLLDEHAEPLRVLYHMDDYIAFEEYVNETLSFDFKEN